MIPKNLFRYSIFAILLLTSKVKAQQQLSFNQGHSHNDYKQNIPLLRAYYAGMGSIEADVFLREGQLYVAHELKEINTTLTLKKQYLEPLFNLYQQNGNHPYADTKLKLQLVIDIKEDHQHVLAQLLKDLQPYLSKVNWPANPDAVRIVVSGDMPAPAEFKNYPDFIYFDGRPAIVYNAAELKQVAMISDALSNYTAWNGKGTPAKTDKVKLQALVDAAHKKGKPFRFWATQDSPNTWVELEKLGVDWINTDAPEKLHDFYLHRKKE